MTLEASSGELRFLDVDASDANGLSGTLDAMFRDEIVGLVIRNAFPAEALAGVVARLERGDCALERHEATYFKGHTFGRILIVSSTDAEQRAYFAEARTFGGACEALFAGGPDFQTRTEEILGAMAEGRPVLVPERASGVPYAAASIRGVVAGGEIDLHCECETLGFPSMRHLETLLDPRGQLSIYLTLAIPEIGGEIHVHGVRFGEGPGEMLGNMDRKGDAVLRAIAPYGYAVPRPGVGDLLVFNAGKHFHRVTPVSGARTRWTMGGFIARSRDHRTVYYWS